MKKTAKLLQSLMKIRPLERTYIESGTEDENGAKRIEALFRAVLRGIEMDSDELPSFPRPGTGPW
jgi:hypothetical protein